MDVFRLRQRLIQEYGSFVESFIRIRNERIKDLVDREIREGLLWPDALLQLNPSFESGGTVESLVHGGILHPECGRIFRKRRDATDPGRTLILHRHQTEAIDLARQGLHYLLTTGTGSGKSLAYIIPIVDHLLRSGPGKGIRAVVVYPMNALANSQKGELSKFLHWAYPQGKCPVRFELYTGQESEEVKAAIIQDPPDILLTNYVMMELILTRPQEGKLVKACNSARFLVLDELHTYRGRQGADVALLVRRARNRFGSGELLCVGTSATLAGGTTVAEGQAETAKVASQLFGAKVEPHQVIGETLKRLTPEPDDEDPLYKSAIRERLAPGVSPPDNVDDFLADPLSAWLESRLGVTKEPESGRLIRSRPKPLRSQEGLAAQLAGFTGIDEHRCEEALQEHLLTGYTTARDPNTGYPHFAFRFHQFVGRGDHVYASLEPEERRHVTVVGQDVVPEHRDRILLPLVFCRECGQEYYSVGRRSQAPGESASGDSPGGSATTGARAPAGREYFRRDLRDTLGQDGEEAGFLYISQGNPWPEEWEDARARLPHEWIEGDGPSARLRADRRSRLPRQAFIAPDGRESQYGIQAWFIPAPFQFCLHCGVAYGIRQRDDFGKLGTLGTEGRSSAITVLGINAVQGLREEAGLDPSARKLLSFTDNRQDASLQAGHFNDFVEVGLLRSALFRAVRETGETGLRHEEIVPAVFTALSLPLPAYAQNPEAKFGPLEQTNRAMRTVIEYRLYRDLKRGWRITMPNLEQSGLLRIEYESLPQIAADAGFWQETTGNRLHPALEGATAGNRERVARVLLDHLRRELAIMVDVLDEDRQESIRRQSQQHLREPWALDEDERLEISRIAVPRGRTKDDGFHILGISGLGGYGQFLRRADVLAGCTNTRAADEVIQQIFSVLHRAGVLEETAGRSAEGDRGFRLKAASIVWKAGDGTSPYWDEIRVPRLSAEGSRPNRFFVNLYTHTAARAAGLEAREHTAQVSQDVRREREDSFRAGKLPILFCSPTMELGVDIADLNVVNMRNIPPTPANYAQRSGRAGRGGQPALVYSYCHSHSPHDRYFFRRPEKMVGGAVSTPRLDLANEDLVRAHVHAIWLAATGGFLGRSLADVLDVSGSAPTLALQSQIQSDLSRESAQKQARERAVQVLEEIQSELEQSDWYTEGWLDEVLKQAPAQFDQACDRWRDLYRAALNQQESQNRIIVDHARPQFEKVRAERLRREAEEQMRLLTSAEGGVSSDFYSYRYFASEGFLPGYSFPRLPLSAYIPGRRGPRGNGDYISRPRFLAITEFGPRTIVYHEGCRYRVRRVILPPTEQGQDGIATTSAKVCGECGYLHYTLTGPLPDQCECCKSILEGAVTDLFRLQNVVTQRAEQITSDEEERTRVGFEIQTAVRFATRGGHLRVDSAEVLGEGGSIARLDYGQAATLWRINLGWKRRANRHQRGFHMDLERGTWARNEAEPDDAEEAMGRRIVRVIPFVEDRKNALLFEIGEAWRAAHGVPSPEMTASLQSALRHAIQAEYQLEESELMAEPLPSADRRRKILLYEASEGGAGVLRHILRDREAPARIARRALKLCHFDPDTGEDLRRPEGAREDCEKACYDCLMSYTNQTDHPYLDRMLIRDYLMALCRAAVKAAPTSAPRAEHLESLKRMCDSDLEREWLELLERHDLHLPSHGQKLIEDCGTRPDFMYERERYAIYIDGPHHRFPERSRRDVQQTVALEDIGFTVLRFDREDDWLALIRRHPSLFGTPRGTEGPTTEVRG